MRIKLFLISKLPLSNSENNHVKVISGLLTGEKRENVNNGFLDFVLDFFRIR